MSSLKIKHKHSSALDNPARWNQYLKPWYDVQAAQFRLDQIVGLNKNGQSIIAIRWGQDVRQRLFDEETPRYWTRRQRQGAEYVYWTVPRWVFEKRMEPEQYVPNWNATRFSLLDDGGVPLNKGDAPTEYFTFAHVAAEHEGYGADQGAPGCCTRQYYENRARCWGLYRPPSELDFTVIAQAVREMEANKFVDPYAPMSSGQLAEAEVAANMQAEEAQRQFEQHEAEMIRDAVKSFGWMLNETDPGVLSHGRYHDLGARHKTIHRTVEVRPTPIAVREHLAAIEAGEDQPQHS